MTLEEQDQVEPDHITSVLVYLFHRNGQLLSYVHIIRLINSSFILMSKVCLTAQTLLRVLSHGNSHLSLNLEWTSFHSTEFNRWLQADSRHWRKFQYCNWHECLGWGKCMLVLFPIFSYKFISHNALLTFCMCFESSISWRIKSLPLYSPLSPAPSVLQSFWN